MSKIITRWSSLSILIMALTTALYSQDFKIKFGDVTEEELLMNKYSGDTSASAVFLGDFGEMRFEYVQAKEEFQVVFTRFTRIKIFNKNGYEWADHKVRLYDHGNLEENLVAFKAVTYNLAGGKIEKTKLTRKSLFSETESEYWKSESFTMPDVQDNCIIEFEYTIKSNYLRNLPEWYFQHTIPVYWSELVIEIPEYFRYKPIMSGYEALRTRESDIGRGKISITSKERSQENRMTTTQFDTQTIEYTTNKERLVAAGIPAFVSEPMLTSYENYISKIRYELESVMFPNSTTQSYAESWQSINKALIENQRFGSQLDGGLYLNDIAGSINSSISDQYEKMVVAYEFIKGNMKWNSTTGIYATSTLRSSFNDKNGSIADINLMLVVLLNKIGLNAAPVILSTRSNGIVNPIFPAATQFNYVIAMVTLGKDIILLDATDPLLPAGMLPERCLNGRGRLVEDGPGNWVDLNTGQNYNYYTFLNIKMDEEGNFNGTMSNNRDGYAAYSLRNMIQAEKSTADFIRKIESNNDGLSITEYSYNGLDSLYKPVSEEYAINITNRGDAAGDMFYINPLFFEQVRRNPFRLEERKYPIDYSYPRTEVYQLSLEIPEGYEVEEMPLPVRILLPENSASFEYSISSKDNKLVLINKISINKPVFISEEYPYLKEFYNKVVEKHAEPVVVKKSL